jgi:hypothetical protein
VTEFIAPLVRVPYQPARARAINAPRINPRRNTMTRVRTALAAFCLAATSMTVVPGAQAIEILTKKFEFVLIHSNSPNASEMASAAWWCMQKGFGSYSAYQFDKIESLGQGYGYNLKYKHITCLRKMIS